MNIEVYWHHENAHMGDTGIYDMKDTFIVSVAGRGAKATVLTPFDEINYRTHDWRVRLAAMRLAKRLHVQGVTKRTLRPLLWNALKHGVKTGSSTWEGRA